MRTAILVLCFALVGSLATQARAAEGGSPEGLLKALYGLYPRKGGASPIFDTPQNWLADPLLQRVREDQRQAAKNGEAGNLDFDPICACQDDTGLKGTKVSVEEEDGKTARVSARFMIGKSTINVRYKLAATPSGWRIADISTKDVPSLLAMLARAQR
ncbi:DUF3828 domain-containing protein [Methylobacterium gnaphalii]|uniref:Uncharacterized protein n=1 Tax=Methylobacterium gnaphalii TaxID=1010610 RepID=A0A512JHF4_9HYPH|nr:DUF3828 domain-containing protein [Methylobacterium gnaphalii]GEP09391.1 hypothetical protein MGN01_12360 [Methylobacterium gnaphalii]GJD68128.1 hypothetical protein MMMDOFMJ_1046 [Methylobacterium gnaphalii]GLS51768.1 hypothetical protein GCM10007885_46290 [Methylobacterium gnaphalii]